MKENSIKTEFKGLPLNTIKEIRDAANKEMKNIKAKMHITAMLYVPVSKFNDFHIAKDWAIRNKLVSRTSNWSFMNFCMLNTIDLIAKQAKAEQAEHNIAVVQKAMSDITITPQDKSKDINTTPPELKPA